MGRPFQLQEMTEDRGRRAEGGGRKSEDRGRKSEDREQRTEGGESTILMCIIRKRNKLIMNFSILDLFYASAPESSFIFKSIEGSNINIYEYIVNSISLSRLKHENSDLSIIKKFSNYSKDNVRELGMLSKRI